MPEQGQAPRRRPPTYVSAVLKRHYPRPTEQSCSSAAPCESTARPARRCGSISCGLLIRTIPCSTAWARAAAALVSSCAVSARPRSRCRQQRKTRPTSRRHHHRRTTTSLRGAIRASWPCAAARARSCSATASPARSCLSSPTSWAPRPLPSAVRRTWALEPPHQQMAIHCSRASDCCSGSGPLRIWLRSAGAQRPSRSSRFHRSPHRPMPTDTDLLSPCLPRSSALVTAPYSLYLCAAADRLTHGPRSLLVGGALVAAAGTAAVS